jgi:succinoglycan biosynthesis protein ExoA
MYGCWRKSTLERVGLFDEELVRGQDYELNARLVSCGGTLWQSPKITFWYRPRASLSALFWQYFQNGFWKVALIRKHPRFTSRRNLVPGPCLLVGVVLPLCAAGASLCGLAFWRHAFLDVWLAFVGLYFVASCASAFSVAKREGWRFLPSLPIVFATYQFSYALGFVLALLYRPANWDWPTPVRKVLTAFTK